MNEKEKYLREKVYENIKVLDTGRLTTSTYWIKKVANMLGGDYSKLSNTQKFFLRNDLTL